MFTRLPFEIILQIAWSIDTTRDLSALSRACRPLHTLLGRVLFDHDAQDLAPWALRWAAEHGDVTVYRKAKDAWAKAYVKTGDYPRHRQDLLDRSLSSALYHAVEEGWKQMIALLLTTQEINIFREKDALLAAAVRNDDPQIVEQLLQTRRFGLDVYSAIHLSVKKGQVHVLKVLLRHCGNAANSTEAGRTTPLMRAADAGDELCVRALLAVEGLNIDARDHAGRTALIWACDTVYSNSLPGRPAFLRKASREARSGPARQAVRLAVVRALCDAGANFMIADLGGDTAMHRAALSELPDIVGYLATKRGTCAAVNRKGLTPLFYLADTFSNPSAMNIDAGDCGRALMLLAVQNGMTSIAETILDADPARFHDVAPDGRTLVKIAEQEGRQDILRLLRRHARSQGLLAIRTGRRQSLVGQGFYITDGGGYNRR